MCGIGQAFIIFQRQCRRPSARIAGQQFRVLRPSLRLRVDGAFPFAIGKRRRNLIPCGNFSNLVTQRLDTLPFATDGCNHGNAQVRLQLVRMDGQSQLLRYIDHVQRQHNRTVEFHELEGQMQAAFQIGCINDIDDDVRRFAKQKVPGDPFFRGK